MQAQIKSVLRPLKKVITVPATPAKPTADCFTDQKRYNYRDGALDANLPKVQSPQSESVFGVLELTKTATFKEMAKSILGVSGDINTLSKLLRERSYTTTLPAIEVLIERQENGEDIGLNINGWANFFFVENKDSSVSVVFVSWLDGQWFVHWYPLSYVYRWHLCRLFARNFPGTL